MQNEGSFPPNLVFKYQNPNVEYMASHPHDIDWNILQKRYCAPSVYSLPPLDFDACGPTFYNQLLEKINWELVSDMVLEEDFILRHSEKINMTRVLSRCHVGEDFHEKIDLNCIQRWYLHRNPYFNKKWKEEHNFSIWWADTNARKIYADLPQETRDDFRCDFITSVKATGGWTEWMKKNNAPCWLLEEVFDFLDKFWLARTQKLTTEFVKLHMGELDMDYVVSNQRLDDTFLIEFRDFLSWDRICKSQFITNEMVTHCYTFMDPEDFEKEHCYVSNGNLQCFGSLHSHDWAYYNPSSRTRTKYYPTRVWNYGYNQRISHRC